MRLGNKTDDEFLIGLNKKNNQIQNIFHEKVKDIAKNLEIKNLYLLLVVKNYTIVRIIGIVRKMGIFFQ